MEDLYRPLSPTTSPPRKVNLYYSSHWTSDPWVLTPLVFFFFFLVARFLTPVYPSHPKRPSIDTLAREGNTDVDDSTRKIHRDLRVSWTPPEVTCLSLWFCVSRLRGRFLVYRLDPGLGDSREGRRRGPVVRGTREDR